MRDEVSIVDELTVRIQAEQKAFNQQIPERVALAWHGYLAGLYEWSIIGQHSYGKLLELLPATAEPDPIVTIFLGYED